MADLPAADYDLLVRYYQDEPWGPWRDNIHAALIAREVARTRMKPSARVDLDPWMVENPEKRRGKRLSGFVAVLKGMAGNRVHISEHKARQKQRRSKRKKRRK